ncbi:MAG TPA: fumarylacetoacetate hydrolase family protein [Armatimonadaceae bacterium]|nr:fumarylacetoacetate hydrolase family protein [Armatimonadaceae bacterium]
MRFALAEVSDGGERLCVVVGGGGELYDLGGLMRESRASGDGVADAPATPLEAAMALPVIGDALASALADDDLRERAALPDGAVRLLAPLPRPNRILAIGRNYAEHAKESGADVFEEPIVFLKASTSVVGPDAPIEIPDWLGRVDFEAELLVVLGKGGKNVSEADAMDLVVGYSVFNDVTAREVQRADQGRKHPWFRSKSVDTFGPMGPYLVTAEEVPDPHALRVTLSVNGETKQDDTTASMVYRIPTLIAFLSNWFLLEPGDVIATGTPSGIGAIVPGDVVEATVEGIGTLRNPVVAV